LKEFKLFGKINIIDIAIILAVIICFVGVYVRFFGQTGKTVVEGTEFTYTLSIKNVRQLSVDMLEDAKGTKFITNENGRNDEFGVLIDYTVNPAIGNIRKTDGTMTIAEVPERYDLTMTFQLKGKVSELGFFTPQLKDIGVGSILNMKSKWLTIRGTVIEVAATL